MGQKGFCGISDELLVARAALHFWEEPPISGTSGSGAVFFSGCSLHCAYCQNSEISGGLIGKSISFNRLIDIYFELEAQGAQNINLVTPTHYWPIVVDSLKQAQLKGMSLPVVWNTSGYETIEAIQMLDGLVDVYLTDFKYFDPSISSRYSDASDYPKVAENALSEMLDQTRSKVIVRHLLLPGCLGDSKNVLEFLSRRFGNSLTLSLMSQYTPHCASIEFPELSKCVSPQEYDDLLDYADYLGFEDYFWQEGEPASESFIPLFDFTGV